MQNVPESMLVAPIVGMWARMGELLVSVGQRLLRWWTGARQLDHHTTDGVRVRYLRIRRPGRPVAVLLHGFSDRPESFLPVASSLRGYDLVLPELPGFHDGAPHQSYTVSNYAHWVISLLDDLGLRGVHLCGNSLGGAVVLLIA
ncbi:MAG: alpha-beta hydrolase superfamily lysophospholipase, partial [Kiritimatiellia bacterium]